MKTCELDCQICFCSHNCLLLCTFRVWEEQKLRNCACVCKTFTWIYKLGKLFPRRLKVLCSIRKKIYDSLGKSFLFIFCCSYPASRVEQKLLKKWQKKAGPCTNCGRGCKYKCVVKNWERERKQPLWIELHKSCGEKFCSSGGWKAKPREISR